MCIYCRCLFLAVLAQTDPSALLAVTAYGLNSNVLKNSLMLFQSLLVASKYDNFQNSVALHLQYLLLFNKYNRYIIYVPQNAKGISLSLSSCLLHPSSVSSPSSPLFLPFSHTVSADKVY